MELADDRTKSGLSTYPKKAAAYFWICCTSPCGDSAFSQTSPENGLQLFNISPFTTDSPFTNHFPFTTDSPFTNHFPFTNKSPFTNHFSLYYRFTICQSRKAATNRGSVAFATSGMGMISKKTIAQNTQKQGAMCVHA